MGLLGDERGQAIQIGAILLFAFLLLAFAGYQAVLVPQQNAGAEADHAVRVSDDVVDVRSTVVNAWSTGETRTSTVHLGATYPPRLLAVNPPSPAGSLRTETAGEITVEVTGAGNTGARQICGQNSVTTRALTYTPDYNEYRDAPTIVYENSVVYRRYDDGTLFDSGQLLVQGRTVNLVALATPYQRSGTSATALDAVPAPSRTTTTVSLNTGQQLEVSFPSQLSAATWDRLLEDQPHDISVSKSGDEVTVTIDGPQGGQPPNQVQYTVVCREVGLDRMP